MRQKILLLFISLLITCNCFAATKILVFGDSLSANYGFDAQQSWVTLLQQRLQQQQLPVEVFNASVSGTTTQEGLKRLPATLEHYQPTITILELGANDGLRGISLTTTQANLAKMIKLIQSKNSQVLLVGLRLPPNYGLTYTQNFQAIFPTLAEQYNVPLVAFLLAGVDDQSQLLQADGLHPTYAAQPQILENIWKELQPLLEKILGRSV